MIHWLFLFCMTVTPLRLLWFLLLSSKSALMMTLLRLVQIDQPR